MLNLNIYKGGDIEDLRDHLVFQMDVARRIVMSINEERRRKGEDLIVQISVIVDLAGAGLSSMVSRQSIAGTVSSLSLNSSSTRATK